MVDTKALSDLAEAYTHGLSEVTALQRESVRRICSQCEEPCCIRVEHLFDEKDVIYAGFHLGRKRPLKRVRKGKGCPYLTPSGCRLEPKERPFVCHRYVCQRLGEQMQQQDPALRRRLEEKLRYLEGLRSRLWEAYLETGMAPTQNAEC
jgi:hypothetical protein